MDISEKIFSFKETANVGGFVLEVILSLQRFCIDRQMIIHACPLSSIVIRRTDTSYMTDLQTVVLCTCAHVCLNIQSSLAITLSPGGIF